MGKMVYFSGSFTNQKVRQVPLQEMWNVSGQRTKLFFYWNVYSSSDLQSSLSTFWWRYHNVAVTEERICINDNNNNNIININNSNIK